MTLTPPTRYFYHGLLFAALILFADQISKILLVDVLIERGPKGIEVLPFFKLIMVWNQGISFGLLSDAGDMRRWLLIGFASVITLVMFVWLWRVQTKWLTFALAFVIGGAVGNIIDRFRWGAVADFFYFHHGEWYWPAFNIADSAIFIGVVLLIWDSIVNPEKSA